MGMRSCRIQIEKAANRREELFPLSNKRQTIYIHTSKQGSKITLFNLPLFELNSLIVDEDALPLVRLRAPPLADLRRE